MQAMKNISNSTIKLYLSEPLDINNKLIDGKPEGKELFN